MTGRRARLVAMLLAVITAFAGTGSARAGLPAPPATAQASAAAAPAPPAPMDPRVRLTWTILGAAGLAVLAITAGPYLLGVLDIGSVSVLCVVTPICY